MVERTVFVVGRREFPTLEQALAAAPEQTPVYRAHYGRRGLKQVERRTEGGHWQRMRSLPIGAATG